MNGKQFSNDESRKEEKTRTLKESPLTQAPNALKPMLDSTGFVYFLAAPFPNAESEQHSDGISAAIRDAVRTVRVCDFG